jgi:hypothetical protein
MLADYADEVNLFYLTLSNTLLTEPVYTVLILKRIVKDVEWLVYLVQRHLCQCFTGNGCHLTMGITAARPQ